ncbi:MAG TPA: phage tail protein [Saprospiraceae bacterium]|nr:phage tail protein [Saprospiraceae bacterium]
MIDYYPPLGFYYKVEFNISKDKNDVRFQSVSGLLVEYDMEEFKEGGENRFTHKLPGRTKYADLVLKRGMLIDSAVTNWCLAAFRDRDFQPADLSIILMNEKSEPLRTWNVTNAIPKKWSVTDLNANENAIIIETLELIYQYFTIK